MTYSKEYQNYRNYTITITGKELTAPYDSQGKESSGTRVSKLFL